MTLTVLNVLMCLEDLTVAYLPVAVSRNRMSTGSVKPFSQFMP